jgi:beta-barrel assembly-enhancing protease
MRLRLWLAVAAFATAGGAATSAPTKQGNEPPPYFPAYEPRTVDERGLWMEGDELERKIRDSQLLIRDEELGSYVRQVLCNTVGSDRCKGVRIYILQAPSFNASMLPNGSMIIQSGLLLRMKNEAELGAVLSHEFAHYELRHSLSAFKRTRSASDVMSWVGVAGGLSGVNTGLLQLSLIGSVFQFNRQQEEHADLLGLKYLAKSSYPASSAAPIWERLMAEQDASAAGRKRTAKHRYSASLFATHPTDLTRATYLRTAAAKIGDSGDPGEASYRAAVGKLLPGFLSDQIKLNDFGGTEYLLGQLASSHGWSPDLLFARGELYRQRGNPRDLVSAAQFYSEAIAKGYAAPEARRNLGLSLLRSGQPAEGRVALTQYLKLKPNASDAPAISALVAQ